MISKRGEHYVTPSTTEYECDPCMIDVKIKDSDVLCKTLDNHGEHSIIAVIDTGIDKSHQCFSNKILKSLNFASDLKVCFDILKLNKVSTFMYYIQIVVKLLKTKVLFIKYFKRYYKCLYFLICFIAPDAKIDDYEYLMKNKYKVPLNLKVMKQLYFRELSRFLNDNRTEVCAIDAYDVYLSKFKYKDEYFYYEDNSEIGNSCNNKHGTYVASVCAGMKTSFCSGIAPSAQLYDLCVQSNVVENGLFFIQDALRWVSAIGSTLNIDIVNMSLGGKYPWGETENILNEIMKQNIICVAATGNNQDYENEIDRKYISYPAGYPNVIAIGSLGCDSNNVCDYNIKSTFSECGKNIDFCCPGYKIIAAQAKTVNETRTISGTSMATPYACGIIALFLGYLKKNNVSHIDNRTLSYTLSKMTKYVRYLQDANLILQDSFNHNVGFGRLYLDESVIDIDAIHKHIQTIPNDWKIEHLRI